jgi:hypothetical protein
LTSSAITLSRAASIAAKTSSTDTLRFAILERLMVPEAVGPETRFQAPG